MSIVPEHIHLLRQSCRYLLPDDLRFVELVVSADGETTKIRFARNRDTLLDLPVSAATLSNLVQAMGHMFGLPPAALPAAIEEYRKQGGPVVVEDY